MSARDIATRRRAIYTGLQPYLDDETIKQALQHWEAKYADQPSMALQRYVAEICDSDELKAKRSAVLRSLVQAMTLPAAQLLPEPAGAIPVSRSQKPTLSGSTALSALVQAMMAQMPPPQQNQIRLDFFAQLRRGKLPPSLLEPLQKWLSSKQSLQLPGASRSQLQEILNQFYILLCENFGPVEADKLLAQAIQRVKIAHPELDPLLSKLL